MTRLRTDTTTLAMSVDAELADFLRGVTHPELYRTRLAPYLLPTPGFHDAIAARQRIVSAREHEIRMGVR